MVEAASAASMNLIISCLSLKRSAAFVIIYRA
jgi:hypothetical protein